LLFCFSWNTQDGNGTADGKRGRLPLTVNKLRNKSGERPGVFQGVTAGSRIQIRIQNNPGKKIYLGPDGADLPRIKVQADAGGMGTIYPAGEQEI
jgi:hypothetical protein